MVMLTFDDAINVININYYRQFYDKYSAGNGCPIGVTYFINHEYNDYSLAHELYTRGHDISVKSITQTPDFSYWANANATVWELEVADMRRMIAKYAALPIEEIEGDRAPYLQPGGDNQFQVLSTNNFVWDASLPTTKNNPPIWPYTLDYKSDLPCQISPCPVDSHPGFWELPMVDFIGGNGNFCAMADQCLPAPTSPEDVFNLLKRNFERHYTTNKAPFGLYIHAAWFQVNQSNFEGYMQFIDYLSSLSDVFILNMRQVMEWMKNPTRLADIGSFTPWQCPTRTAPTCSYRNCRYTGTGTPSGYERYMASCVTCPPYYPWLGNVDGRNPYPH